MPQNALSSNVAQSTSGAGAPMKLDANSNLKSSNRGAVLPAPVIASGTITATGTFQAALAANNARLPGGYIQNRGTAAMSVCFSSVASAATIKSLLLAAGSFLYMNDVFGGNIYTGVVAITGTTADGFATLENSGTI